MKESAPLEGIRVVEVADDLPAAWCARQFAAWGADVIIVEAAEGSRLRTAAPKAPGTEVSVVWEYIAAGKRSAGQGQLAELLSGADVLVTDRPPPAVPQETVVVSVTALGPRAGIAGTDLIAQALSGYMSMSGEPGRPPLRVPANLLAYFSGAIAFAGALAALYDRDRTGVGQLVDVSMLEAIASLVPYTRTEYLHKPDARLGYAWTGQRLHAAKDAYVCIYPYTGLDQIVDAVRVAGVDVADEKPEEADYPSVLAFVDRHLAQVPAEAFVRALWAVLKDSTIYQRVQEPGELPRHEQLVAREYFFDVDHPRLGRVPFAGLPARISGMSRESPTPSPAPAGGAVWVTERLPTDAGGPRTGPPLQGIRIIDLTQAWAGPYATQLVADLGADVIKVESLTRPDPWRTIDNLAPVHTANPDAWRGNVNPLFNSVNRNKRSLTLNLRTDEGKGLLLELVKSADALVENFSAGTLERMGLGEDVLRAVKPDIVIGSLSGYGKTGPFAAFRANGTAIETVSGWNAMHGYPGEHPLLMGFYQADAMTGLQLAVTTLLALRPRGLSIDGAMFEAAVGYIGDVILYASLGGNAGCTGNRHPGMAPHGAFRAAGDDDWVAIAVRDDADWSSFVRLVPELADKRFASTEGRLAHVDALEMRVEAWTSLRPAREAMGELQAIGVPAGAVNRTDQALDDPHLSPWFISMHHPDMGTHRYPGFPWRFSRSVLSAIRCPPRLGEHSEDILHSELGLTLSDLTRLRETGVTGAVLSAQDAPKP